MTKDDFEGASPHAGPHCVITKSERWLYRSLPHDDWGVVRESGERPWVIAQVRHHCSEEELAEHRRNGTDPCEARGRLIAQAPRMLEALRELVAAADDYATSDPDMPSHAETERRFNNAQAKATHILADLAEPNASVREAHP